MDNRLAEKEASMDRLQTTYRLIHQQGFIPIFTHDEFDSKRMVEACVNAGCRAIEYTLRRPDAHEMIPWIRKNYPDLRLLAGSTLDGNSIVNQTRSRHPQLLTLDELAAMGVDGFVSMVAFRPETLARYAAQYLMIAPVFTVYEAYCAIESGAYFVKVAGTRLELANELGEDAAFGFCPIMVTGGISRERIPVAIQAGAVLVGAGLDIIFRNAPPEISTGQATEALRTYLRTTCRARAQRWPTLAQASDNDFSSWSAALPHYCPFDTRQSKVGAER